MGFQFIHIETYGRNPPKKGGGKASMRGVFAEAKREPDACPHVSEPRPPVHVYGMELDALGAEINAAASVAKDARGHALRKDAAVLLAGVATYPAGWDHLDKAAYAEWEQRTLQWLREEFGENLKAVVRHVDESYPHIHFYAAPELVEGGRFNAKDLHAGHRAAAGLRGGDAQAAYKAAMREFQDRYHDQVGAPCGLTRLGPSRRRLSRAAWKAEQAQAEALRGARIEAAAAKAKASSILFDARIDSEVMRRGAAADASEAKAEAERNRQEADKARLDAEAELLRLAAEKERVDRATEQAQAWFQNERTKLEADKREFEGLRQQLGQAKTEASQWFQSQRADIDAQRQQIEVERQDITEERRELANEWELVAALKLAYEEISGPLRQFAHDLKRWATQFRDYIKPPERADQALEVANSVLDQIDTSAVQIRAARDRSGKATLSMH